MSYASPAERLALRASVESSGFVFDFVLQIRKNGRESEITCDNVDHALMLSHEWATTHGADYVEIWRVRNDGELASTIGPTIGQK